jgi:hypothetical protein
MSNPLYNMFGGNTPMNPMAQLVRDAKAFRKSFTGNPRDEVQRLLNSTALQYPRERQKKKVYTDADYLAGASDLDNTPF